MNANAGVAAGAIAGAAAVAAVAAGGAPALAATDHPAPADHAELDSNTLVVHPPVQSLEMTQLKHIRRGHETYTVRAGNTLSGIAKRFCGNAGDYPSLASANHVQDPNLIMPGESIKLACHAAVAAVAAALVRPARHYKGEVSSGGKVWDVTFGYPNKCGDGDGDGWDEACAALHPAAAPADPAPQPAAPAVSVTGVGTLGMSGFEACVIRAESGGNPASSTPPGPP
jgi:LysM repeat protein